MLQEELAKRIRLNPGYSLRAFARDLGVTHAYLSMVLRGKRKLSPQKLVFFSQKLNLEQKFLASYLGKNSQKKKVVQSSISLNQFSSYLKVLGDWYYIAVLDLINTKDFTYDPVWISRRLGINSNLVAPAVQVLREIGLIEISKGKYKKAQPHLEISTKQSLDAVRLYHEEIMKKAIEVMKEHSQSELEKRSISTDTFSVNPSKIPLIKRRLEKFRKECIQELTTGDCSEVMALGIQFFPLTKFRQQS